MEIGRNPRLVMGFLAQRPAGVNLILYIFVI
jgi:hypothetical protein